MYGPHICPIVALFGALFMHYLYKKGNCALTFKGWAVCTRLNRKAKCKLLGKIDDHLIKCGRNIFLLEFLLGEGASRESIFNNENGLHKNKTQYYPRIIFKNEDFSFTRSKLENGGKRALSNVSRCSPCSS